MASRTITQYLFNDTPDVLKLRLKSRDPVIRIGGGSLFVGRTPGRFTPVLGHSCSEALSIKDALEPLGANEAARRIFPLAATPGSHWIYFALFSSCKKNPGVAPLNRYISFLADKLDRRNAGVARRLLANSYSTRELKEVVKRARRVHDIRRRLDESTERKWLLNDLVRLDKLVRSGRRSHKNFKHLARKFRASWCRQSKLLCEQNNHVLVKCQDPAKLHAPELLKVYAGYWLIRALYGIELTSSSTDDDKTEVDTIDAPEVRKAAKSALLCLHRIFKSKPDLQESMAGVLDDLQTAQSSGKPPLIHEYFRRQALGKRVLNGFRLTRFWNVLDQLDKSVAKGLR